MQQIYRTPMLKCELNKFFLNIYLKHTSGGADPEILKRGDAQSRPPWLANKESFKFQMV